MMRTCSSAMSLPSPWAAGFRIPYHATASLRSASLRGSGPRSGVRKSTAQRYCSAGRGRAASARPTGSQSRPFPKLFVVLPAGLLRWNSRVTRKGFLPFLPLRTPVGPTLVEPFLEASHSDPLHSPPETVRLRRHRDKVLAVRLGRKATGGAPPAGEGSVLDLGGRRTLIESLRGRGSRPTASALGRDAPPTRGGRETGLEVGEEPGGEDR